MLVAVDNVQQQRLPNCCRQLCDRAVEKQAVGRAFKMRIGLPPLAKESIFLLTLCNLLKRDLFESLFTEEHQDSVSCYAMKPSCESRLTAKITDSAEHGEKGLLSQVLGLSWIFCHAKTEGIDTRKVQVVEPFKSGCVAMPCPTQSLAFRQSGLCMHRMEKSFLHTPSVPPTNTRRVRLVAPRSKACCKSKN